MSQPDSNNKNLGTYVGVGIALGVAFGVAFDNIGLGIALGLAIGASIGRKKDLSDAQQSHEVEPDSYPCYTCYYAWHR